MMDPMMMSMMGGGMGGQGATDPDAMKRMMLMKMLMGGAEKKGGHAGGISQLGNALMAGLLMNPDGMKSMRYGMDNLFSGKSWGAIPRPELIGPEEMRKFGP